MPVTCVVQLAIHTLKKKKKKLDAVHNIALRILSGAFCTSPVESLCTDCIGPPLKLLREELSLRLYYHILSHTYHPFKNHLLSTENDMLYKNKPSFIPAFGF